MSLDLLKERFGHSPKKGKDNKQKINEQLNDKFNSNGIDDLKSFKSRHQEELEEKERVIENLEIETSKLANEVLTLEKEKSTIIQELNNSKWMENTVASNTKKIYEDKIKTMSIVDSTELIPLLVKVSRQKQGNQKLNWGEWLEIPENTYLLQINQSIAKKVFEDSNRLIDEYIRLLNERRRGRGREPQETTAVDTDYILTFAGESATDYVATTFNPDNYDGTGTGLNHGFTVSFWINPAQVTGTRKALGRRPAEDARFDFGIKSATLMHVGVGAKVYLDNDYNDGVETGHEMEAGNWYNWVVTYGGDDSAPIGGDRLTRIWINGKEIYKDGAASGTGNENGMGTANWREGQTDEVNASSYLYFGARSEFHEAGGDGPYNQGWACSLSEVAIYKTEIDEDGTFANEVYDAGFGYDHRNNSNLVGYWRLNEGSGTRAEDLSGNGNHGTLTTSGTEIPTWTKNESYS